METFSFHVPTKVVFGMGALTKLPEELRERGLRSALVITDPGVGAAGLLARLEEQLQAAQVRYGVYDGVVPNPTVASVEAAVPQAKAHEALIALGGGSALDTAKALNVLRTHGGKVLDWAPYPSVPGPCGPLVAIPTTAGTGSEVTPVAMVTASSKGTPRKVPLVSPHLFPDVALVDPELTQSLPPAITAATGMDALTHAIEAMTTLTAQPLADLLAREAIERVDRFLARAVRDGGDVKARREMCFSALLAGMAFRNAWVALAHAIAHALGGLYDLPHGLCCAWTLPLAMEYNLDARRAQYEQIAKIMGRGEGGAKGAVARVRELAREIGIPSGPRERGIPETDAAKIAELAVEDPSLMFNPKPVPKDEMLALVQRLFEG